MKNFSIHFDPSSLSSESLEKRAAAVSFPDENAGRETTNTHGLCGWPDGPVLNARYALIRVKTKLALALVREHKAAAQKDKFKKWRRIAEVTDTRTPAELSMRE